MIIVLSPAKTLDYRTPPTLADHSQPFLARAVAGADRRLRELSPAQLASLMKISDQLAVLNATATPSGRRRSRRTTPSRRFWPSTATSTTASTPSLSPTICALRRRICAFSPVSTGCCDRST
jgi:hypothetical protein